MRLAQLGRPPEVGAQPSGALRAGQGERHPRQRERPRVDQVAVLEAGVELLLPLEQAAEVASAPVGELSVAWNDYLGRWIMTYLDEVRRAIVLREAPELTGPWSVPIEVVSANDYPSLYGAYLHPWGSDGEIIYFNMSQWGPYNVMLMRVRLVKTAQP